MNLEQGLSIEWLSPKAKTTSLRSILCKDIKPGELKRLSTTDFGHLCEYGNTKNAEVEFAFKVSNGFDEKIVLKNLRFNSHDLSSNQPCSLAILKNN